MNRQLIIGCVVGGLTVTAIGAAAGYRFLDTGEYATVMSAEPATRTVSVPRERCRDELVTRTRATRDPEQVAGTVVGAVLGGVLGNQVGAGSGKKLATVGGVVAGGYAGNQIQEGMQERNTYQETRRNCETVNDKRQEPAGYDVTYRLAGQEGVIRMAYDPGERIPVEDGRLVIRDR